jgi:hypothetical protein
MKYGQTFQAQSVLQWAPYNIDYNELKNLIKVHTTKNQGQAITIPGHDDAALRKFEDLFFNELYNQHDRVDLFVKSKADEISRRLQHLQKGVLRLLARCTYSNGKKMSLKRRERFAKYDGQITRCGDDIKLLSRFVDAQRMAFYKILKKYKKWTGSQTLSTRFNDEVLGNPKSFTKRYFEPLFQQYNDLLSTLRASSPNPSEPTTPRTRSGQQNIQVPVQQVQQAYWNEYDDGSEAENEPYTIYVDPDAESTFPGAKTFVSAFSRAKAPLKKVKAWLSPGSSLGEQRPLLSNGGNFTENPNATDTEVDDDAYASSTDFPGGYAAHYATFPSISDQKLFRHRESLLFRGTIGSFVAASLLHLIAGTLVATGRHRLRIEVNTGVIVGVVASLFFAVLGFGMMLYRKERLSWLHRICVGVTFVAICVLNGMLLVLVVGNTGL